MATPKDISLGQILEESDSLVAKGFLGFKNGFYFLSGRDALFDLRIEREKISAQKWKKLLKIARWFQAVPYLRAILVSGSMSINNADKESDFDILSVARSGRLYTCRIFLCLVASVFRSRRTRFDLTAPDKFCFNHYITDGALNIKYESLYNAQTYIGLKPVISKDDVFNKFYEDNNWLTKYVVGPVATQDFVSRSISPSVVLSSIAKLAEILLDSFLGDKIEYWLKKYQQKRIRNNPATYESGGRVVFNDDELEFHPRSFEALAIDRYNKKLKKFGVALVAEEKDSGLTF